MLFAFFGLRVMGVPPLQAIGDGRNGTGRIRDKCCLMKRSPVPLYIQLVFFAGFEVGSAGLWEPGVFRSDPGYGELHWVRMGKSWRFLGGFDPGLDGVECWRPHSFAVFMGQGTLAFAWEAPF